MNTGWNAGFCYLLALLVLPSASIAQDQVSANSGKQLFEQRWEWKGPAPRMTEAEMRRQNLGIGIGFGFSAAIGREGDGLGPLHNATSCVECHQGGGASGVRHNVTRITIDPRSKILEKARQSRLQTIVRFFPGLLSGRGRLSLNAVVHDQSTREGYLRIRYRLANHVPGGIDDAWFEPEKRTTQAIAKQPVIAGRYKTIDFYLSQRNTPALWGIGAIEEIDPVRLQKIAEKQARETNGKVTGRIAGKFGWRGQTQSLSEFVSGECARELGLNHMTGSQANDLADRSYANFGADISPNEMLNLTNFVADIPRPIEKPQAGHTLSEVLNGEKSFRSVGCIVCHVPDLHPTSGMFSDLLLHDMGPELQAAFPAPFGELQGARFVSQPSFPQFFANPSLTSSYHPSGLQPLLPAALAIAEPSEPQFPRGNLTEQELSAAGASTWDAMQREWRTPPLWGVADTAPYLHDGRAETLEESILLHGGEAQDSRDKFNGLSRIEKDGVIIFLSSLRAPKTTIQSHNLPTQ